MIYNRALHTDDYAELELGLAYLHAHEKRLQQKSVPYRKDHTHREWEYARILQQLWDLFPDVATQHQVRILDTGSGASYFPPLLKVLGYDIAVSDSMDYGDITDWLRQQCFALDITIPLIVAPVQRLGLEDNKWDVTMCISVIEHLAVEQFQTGLRELWRVTKPGGYLFITSDYFENEERALQSPSLGIQHNRFYPHTAEAMINDAIDVEWVGGVDLTYRGDFVNGHSFVNFVLRKP